MSNIVSVGFVNDIKDLLRKAKAGVMTTINVAMVYTYYEIGRRIVEQEQKGEDRAEYGKEIMQRLANSLSKEFGKGYSYRNLKLFRQFYLVYSKDDDICCVSQETNKMIFYIKNQIRQPLDAQSVFVSCETKQKGYLTNVADDNKDMIFFENQKGQTLYAQSDIVPYTNDGKQFFLSWSHYVILIRIKDVLERHFYEIETYNNNWSKRELIRQYDSGLYLRLIKSKDKEKVLELSRRGQILEKPEDAIKEPLVLDFLHLPEDPTYSEKELETRIINNIEQFIKELGKGFVFAERQARITFGEKHFYADLVFYNRILRCFVIIDLKIGELKHQDIGQMQMYVNYFDRYVKLPEENKTIGLLLCRQKDDAIVKLTLPEDNNQIFASEYETVLPSREDLIRLIQEK